MPASKERAVLLPPYGPSGACATSWDAFRAAWRSDEDDEDCVIFRGSHAATSPASPLSVASWQAGLCARQTRVVNIQEPWATLIALGIKDVENRSIPYPGEFMVIVASKPHFSAPEWVHRMQDVERRLRWHVAAGNPAPSSSYTREQASYRATAQHAIAIARVQSVCNAEAAISERQSIWNNGDAYAWRIVDVLRLATPVHVGKGTLGLNYLNRQEPLARRLRECLAQEAERRGIA